MPPARSSGRSGQHHPNRNIDGFGQQGNGEGQFAANRPGYLWTVRYNKWLISSLIPSSGVSRTDSSFHDFDG